MSWTDGQMSLDNTEFVLKQFAITNYSKVSFVDFLYLDSF